MHSPTSILQHYKSGVLTDSYLNCSDPEQLVNHAVVLVGYGKVNDKNEIKGQFKQCEEYWLVRELMGTQLGRRRLLQTLHGWSWIEQQTQWNGKNSDRFVRQCVLMSIVDVSEAKVRSQIGEQLLGEMPSRGKLPLTRLGC